MSNIRKIARNIARNDRKELEKYGSQLNPNWAKKTPQEINIFANLARNGITPEYMMSEIAKVKQDTYDRTVVAVKEMDYASMAIVLHEKFGFSKDDCFDIILAVDQNTTLAIDNEALLREMEEKVGLRFNPKDGVGRLEKV